MKETNDNNTIVEEEQGEDEDEDSPKPELKLEDFATISSPDKEENPRYIDDTQLEEEMLIYSKNFAVIDNAMRKPSVDGNE